MNNEVEIYIGGNLYRLDEDESGCSKCALKKQCFRGKELYKSRAWLCQLFKPGIDCIFTQVHGITINKEENYEQVYC